MAVTLYRTYSWQEIIQWNIDAPGFPLLKLLLNTKYNKHGG